MHENGDRVALLFCHECCVIFIIASCDRQGDPSSLIHHWKEEGMWSLDGVNLRGENWILMKVGKEIGAQHQKGQERPREGQQLQLKPSSQYEKLVKGGGKDSVTHKLSPLQQTIPSQKCWLPPSGLWRRLRSDLAHPWELPEIPIKEWDQRRYVPLTRCV